MTALHSQVVKVLLLLALLIFISAIAVTMLLDTGIAPIVTTAVIWGGMAILVWQGLSTHPFATFGSANVVTSVRAAGTAILAGLIPMAAKLDAINTQSGNDSLLWGMCAGVIALLSLDGVDGYLARKTGLSSTFGARFDMEIDAFLALVIAAFLWQYGEAGIWILGLGVMRYLFVLASVWSAPLRAPLFPSFRRKVVCVIQLAALCAMLSPIIQGSLSIMVGGIALLALAGSFARDIHWLYSQGAVS